MVGRAERNRGVLHTPPSLNGWGRPRSWVQSMFQNSYESDYIISKAFRDPAIRISEDIASFTGETEAKAHLKKLKSSN